MDVIYRIDKYRDIIYIEYRGKTDKSTPLDMTNHTYFNLNGHDSDLKVLNHEVKIFADNYLVSNPKDWITTGEINSVENTKLDFRDYTKLKDRMKLDDMSDGYNDYFIVNQQSGSKYSARYYYFDDNFNDKKVHKINLKCEKSREWISIGYIFGFKWITVLYRHFS